MCVCASTTYMRSKRAVMIVATRQNTGKTSVALSIMSGMRKIFGDSRVAYMKPVGQQHHLLPDGTRVESDALLMKNYFHLDHCSLMSMSPIIIDKTYTRDYLNGKIDLKNQLQMVKNSFEMLCQNHDFVVVEGSGHVAVGSVIDMPNVKVAKELGIGVIVVCNGGIGRSFDELSLCCNLCDQYSVPIHSVIFNKIRHDNFDMVRCYMEKACAPKNLPVMSYVPDKRYMHQPSMKELESVFHTKLLSGVSRHGRSFDRIEVVTTSLGRLIQKLCYDERMNRTCFITHATRDDIILGILTHSSRSPRFEGGLVVTGAESLSPEMHDYILNSSIPSLRVHDSTSRTLRTISRFVSKLHAEDKERIVQIIQHYDQFLDCRQILNSIC